jgi:hypothetical protein
LKDISLQISVFVILTLNRLRKIFPKNFKKKLIIFSQISSTNEVKNSFEMSFLFQIIGVLLIPILMTGFLKRWLFGEFPSFFPKFSLTFAKKMDKKYKSHRMPVISYTPYVKV